MFNFKLHGLAYKVKGRSAHLLGRKANLIVDECFLSALIRHILAMSS